MARGAVVGPTVDSVAGIGSSFLPDTPIKLIRKGKFQRVPFVVGVNSEEGIVEARSESLPPRALALKNSDNQYYTFSRSISEKVHLISETIT